MAEATAHGTTVESRTERRERRLAWFTMLGSPLLVLVNMQASYMLVDWACLNDRRIVLYLVPPVFLLASLTCGIIANGIRRRYTSASATRLRAYERLHFMGTVGALLSILSSLAILMQWIATLMIDPCRP
jgi:hypothetical protein